MQPPKPHKTKAEQLDEALTHLKTRSTVLEMNLEDVLKKKNVSKKEYNEAKQLLARVTIVKYNICVTGLIILTINKSKIMLIFCRILISVRCRFAFSYFVLPLNIH